MTLIAAKNLSLAYGKNRIIDSANFAIEQGDFVCVVGANGSGKSTLIKAMLGLIKPVNGKIIFGDDLEKTKIGYLPQASKIDQGFPATVMEVVQSGALGRLGKKVFYQKEDKNVALESLKKLHIEKLKDKSFMDLSGGQRQKVLLARALTATTKLLILDEPSNNLDPSSRKSFYEILQELNKEQNLTIIMITHDLDADDLIGNKIIAIKEGNVTQETTEKFLEAYK
jgi:zinc transport system ATP-binding protein